MPRDRTCRRYRQSSDNKRRALIRAHLNRDDNVDVAERLYAQALSHVDVVVFVVRLSDVIVIRIRRLTQKCQVT